MCVIIASSTGKSISEEIIDDAAQRNSHGGGIAWLIGQKIRFRKGLKPKEVSETLEKEVRGAPWVVHFRIATHGGISPGLTHPFPIAKDTGLSLEGEADSVLFHNGVFGQWKEYLLQAAGSSGTAIPEGPWSDTRGLAFCCGVYGKHFLSLLDNHSRFLIFDGKAEPKSRMMLWGDWTDHDEAFKFSNTGSCAFDKKYDYSQSGGGRSANFPSRAAAANERSATGEATTALIPGTSTAETKSSANTPGTSATNKRRTFSPRPNHDYWRRFDKTGVRADNEATA